MPFCLLMWFKIAAEQFSVQCPKSVSLKNPASWQSCCFTNTGKSFQEVITSKAGSERVVTISQPAVFQQDSCKIICDPTGNRVAGPNNGQLIRVWIVARELSHLFQKHRSEESLVSHAVGVGKPLKLAEECVPDKSRCPGNTGLVPTRYYYSK